MTTMPLNVLRAAQLAAEPERNHLGTLRYVWVTNEVAMATESHILVAIAKGNHSPAGLVEKLAEFSATDAFAVSRSVITEATSDSKLLVNLHARERKKVNLHFDPSGSVTIEGHTLRSTVELIGPPDTRNRRVNVAPLLSPVEEMEPTRYTFDSSLWSILHKVQRELGSTAPIESLGAVRHAQHFYSSCPLQELAWMALAMPTRP